MKGDLYTSEELLDDLEKLIGELRLTGEIPPGSPSQHQRQLIDYSYDIVDRLRTGNHPRHAPTEE